MFVFRVLWEIVKIPFVILGWLTNALVVNPQQQRVEGRREVKRLDREIETLQGEREYRRREANKSGCLPLLLYGIIILIIIGLFAR